ncbi:MAG TPA: WecB/TagA/CpsF family glycosyltransferase [Mesotoga sp.]|uniref:WecB/TagA/CpsF family glycosyltransferase n=1 Tax=unclassified Mesotoga TaxID=1184398 RepID=UPI0025F4583A|nr:MULTISPECIES: WecB/TagA/CpsF family glycosyltransferase [unclassified Mesotoga]MDD3459695.1 WecB/TagA/CpsF family glycosyltransferase [Mesotoga sp.]HNS34501.1 WecB/TagA/CpsF family glycosyltransferase [Mesotoga sp.]HNU24414.1 WecB/TagA/CpsF family glycosyltransferase [Mesotoga sp.]
MCLQFLDFDLQEKDLVSAADELIQRTQLGVRSHVLTLNALIAYEYINNEEYKKALSTVNYVVPDGSGVLKAIKLISKQRIERVPGIDLMLKICELSSGVGQKIFLLGSKESIVTKTTEKLKQRFPLIDIVGYHSGFFTQEESDTIVSKINNSSADIVFVGMGVPRQDIWIAKNLDRLNAMLLMGVGGSFDVISGDLKRAPLFMQKAGLEWLYRIFQEPGKRLKIIPKLFSFECYVIRSYFESKRGGSR